MDILMPFIRSKWNNIELTYCLRGIEKHLSGVDKIYIIGDNPGMKNVIHVPMQNDHRPEYKEKTIYEKILKGFEFTDLALYVNDDHFLTGDYVAKDFPNYWSKWPQRDNLYRHTMENTRTAVNGEKFWDLHCPQVFKKKRFMDKVASVDWNKPGGYCLKTLYSQGLKGEEYLDLKIRLIEPIEKIRTLISTGKWFSACDQARSYELETVLKELYPDKSKYEI